MSCIVAADLTKSFAGGADAVCGVSFEVAEGEIVGLLGPNGAGKSTTLNMLATLIAPTGGDAWIQGVPIRDRVRIRRLVGVALQATGVDPLMTVEQHFRAHAALFGMSWRTASRRSDQLMAQFRLDEVRAKRTGDLSGGTQRRLSLALSLVHDPKVVILDEPTVGLDPVVRREMWDYLLRLRSSGVTILFSTHYLEEADRLCDRILLLSAGRITASGTPDDLKSASSSGMLRVRVRGDLDGARAVVARLTSDGTVRDARFGEAGSVLEIPTALADAPTAVVVEALQTGGADVAGFEWSTGNLEDAYSRLSRPVGEESSARAVALEHRAHARRRRMS